MLKAVVLAAGKGSRLYPVTYHVAKPLLPLANRTTMFYAFDRLREMGIEEVCVVVGENEPQMREKLGDGHEHGLKLSFVRQENPHGLAHAVGFAKDFVAGDPFVLYLGDAIYSQGFQAFAQQFAQEAERSGAANLNIVAEVDDPRRYGVANLDGDRIVRLVEKPQNPESNWVMAGLYFFGPQLWDVLPDLQPSARGEYEITDAIQMLIDRGQTVLAGKYRGSWFDTGTLPSYLETNEFLANGQTLVDPSAIVSAELGEGVIIGAGAEVHVKRIEHSVVLPGSKLTGDAHVSRSFLGGEAVLTGLVENVILFDGKGA
jgi:glucose-1-phosphate thymidylyltransferase